MVSLRSPMAPFSLVEYYTFWWLFSSVTNLHCMWLLLFLVSSTEKWVFPSCYHEWNDTSLLAPQAVADSAIFFVYDDCLVQNCSGGFVGSSNILACSGLLLEPGKAQCFHWWCGTESKNTYSSLMNHVAAEGTYNAKPWMISWSCFNEDLHVYSHGWDAERSRIDSVRIQIAVKQLKQKVGNKQNNIRYNVDKTRVLIEMAWLHLQLQQVNQELKCRITCAGYT